MITPDASRFLARLLGWAASLETREMLDAQKEILVVADSFSRISDLSPLLLHLYRAHETDIMRGLTVPE